MANVTEFATEAEAAEAFVDINGEAKRVSLQHVLSVSSSDYAVNLRDIAKKYDVSIQIVHNLIGGIVNKQNAIKVPISKAQWAVSEKVLNVWTKQKRWGLPNNVFATAGNHAPRRYFTAKASNTDSMLADLLKLDYARSSSLGRMAGTSFNSQKEMRQFVYESIAKQVI